MDGERYLRIYEAVNEKSGEDVYIGSPERLSDGV